MKVLFNIKLFFLLYSDFNIQPPENVLFKAIVRRLSESLLVCKFRLLRALELDVATAGWSCGPAHGDIKENMLPGLKISIQYPSGSWMKARFFIFPEREQTIT